jgi:hypothetical protein
MNAQVIDLGVPRWSYLSLTRTPHKPLTCSLPHHSAHQPRARREIEQKRPLRLRERLDEREIAELISAYRKVPPPPPSPLPAT